MDSIIQYFCKLHSPDESLFHNGEVIYISLLALPKAGQFLGYLFVLVVLILVIMPDAEAQLC